MSPRLAGSWEHVGRKPRVFRCLASKTRHREIAAFFLHVPATPGGRLGVGVSFLIIALIAHFLTWKHLFAERPFCLRCRSATKVAKNKKRGRIFVVHQGNCFARPCSSRLERNAGVGMGSHFSATPTPTRPRAPQKRKPATTRSPPPLL